MPRSLKRTILYAVGALCGLFFLATIALRHWFDADTYKPRFETAASSALGMEVSVGGHVGIGLFPGLLVTLADVHIRNRGADVASAKEVRLGIDFLPLLRKEIRIENIALEHPSIAIEKDREGRFNLENPAGAEGASPSLNLARATMSDATFHYLDKQTGAVFEAKQCRLNANRLRLPEGARSGMMKRLVFAADIACGDVRTKDYAASDLKFSVVGQNGVFDLKPVTLRAFGGQGSGSLQADFSGAVPIYRLSYSLSRLHIEEYFKTRSPERVAEGTMDFSADLTMQGKTVHELRQTAQGRLSLRGKNLVLNGRDLDREFDRFESSQNFNLVDVGALFFAGPVGLAITKGYNFASLLQGSGGRSEIRVLVSDWQVERGVAQAQDVAMATDKNRVALRGGLDFVNERFDDVTVALIDARGCAKVRQRILGTFQQPVIEKPSTLMSITAPVRKLFKQVEKLFPGGECEAFYAGSVAQPQ